MGRHRHAALSFNDGAKDTRTAAVRGGKGSSLAIMADIGLPVPPGFTLSTTVSRAYMEHGRIPARVLRQIDREIARLEKITGRTFGDPDNPLLVSVRSGAEQSMPGMMDTLLNIGIDREDTSGLLRWGGKRFARDTKSRFLSQWKETFPSQPLPPLDAYMQLLEAITAVLESWNSERAIAYRNARGIPHHLGTAVTVQAMVFGNIDQQSCTGVVFSADVATGQRSLYGEFLPRAQGEDVVSGSHTPRPIAEMQSWNPKLHAQLEEYVRTLESHYSDVVDVEFTVEKGVLYILQCRKAKRSPLAQVTWAVRDTWRKDNPITKQQALERVSASEVSALRQPTFSQQTVDRAVVIAKGLPASPGAVTGVVALTSEQAQQYAAEGKSVVLVRDDTSPNDLPGMLVSKAIVTANGGATSHAAVVARELGLPAVVGSTLPSTRPTAGTQVSVDGSRGLLMWGNLPLEEMPSVKEVNIFMKWWDAHYVYKPRIGFEWVTEQLSANTHLNDFYLSEMMARVCTGTKHEAEAIRLRRQVHERVAESFAAYLLIAISGEARNYQSYAYTKTQEANAASAYLNGVLSGAALDRSGVQHQVITALNGKGIEQHIAFATNARSVFADATWSTAFGGPKWAAIAKALLDFLTGELTLTLFVDHVFDLKHNGGCLFNKHPMFSRNTREGRAGRGGIYDQLDDKKRVSDPTELYRRLTARHDASADVVAMWGLVKRDVL